MRKINSCVGLLLIAGLTGACSSDSAARLSPNAPSAIAPGSLASDSSGGVRNSAFDGTSASGGGTAGDPGATAGGGSTGGGGDAGATAGGGSTAGGGDAGASAGGGSTAGGGDSGATAGGGSSAGGGDAGATAGGGSTGGGGDSSGGGSSGGGATGGSTVTVTGVVAYATGGCPAMEMRLQTAPYTIVTGAGTTFVSNGATTSCVQVQEGSTVSVTGTLLPQTEPSHSPTVQATRVKVK